VQSPVLGPPVLIKYYPVATVNSPRTTGECWTAAIATYRNDAWRCSYTPISGRLGNSADPCFSESPQATSVMCSNSPFGDEPVLIVDLTKPVPLDKAWYENNDPVKPWWIELEDGTRCVWLSGTGGPTVLAVPERTNYGCGFNQDYRDNLIWLSGLPKVEADGSWTITKLILTKDPNTDDRVRDAQGAPISSPQLGVVSRIRTVWR
jgi:hypothetical protein